MYNDSELVYVSSSDDGPSSAYRNNLPVGDDDTDETIWAEPAWRSLH